MASTPARNSVFSETLQSITNTKLEEVSNKRAIFERQKAVSVDAAQHGKDSLEKLRLLFDGVKTCMSVKTASDKGHGGLGRIMLGGIKNPGLEVKLKNLERFLEQARYDPSVSPKLIQDWHSSLLQILNAQTLKYQYASLYGELVTEWLSAEKGVLGPSDGDWDMTEVHEDAISAERLEARAEWARSVFSPFETDRQAIDAYLNDLFGKTGTNKQAFEALKLLQTSVSLLERELAMPEQFNQNVLNWTINGLLASDLLTDEKRAVLKDFKNDRVVLSEVADVLNMRISALDSWNWGGDVPIEDRKRINGSYNIYMHEDLLQAIFLQFIGVKWSVLLKKAFKAFSDFDGAWASRRTTIPKIDLKRRHYFTGHSGMLGSVQSERMRQHKESYFCSQLLDSEDQDVVVDEGDEEADYEMVGRNRVVPRTRQMARISTGVKPPPVVQGQFEDFRRTANVDFSGGEYPEGPKNPMEAKQNLLHILSTEILDNTRLYGELTCVHSEFEDWNPSLPHSTIYSVLSFFGVSTKWLSFFERFLEAPLKFSGASEVSRIRRRGVPGSHVLSDVLGEVILFCLDFSVNQSTAGAVPLYRMCGDLWLWSSDQQNCVKAWRAATKFAETMGVSLNEGKTGTARIIRQDEKSRPAVDPSLPKGIIRWGFIYLDPSCGRFKIDQSMVDLHIKELRHQLQGKTKSVFAWVQAWNTYASTFFTTNFGKPANCFGQEHVDMMLATLERVQRSIFPNDDSGSVVEFLKATLHQRFGLAEVPDGYLFFPAELGGLELKSPFVGLLQIRNAVPAQPSSLLDAFELAEAAEYRSAKIKFDTGKVVRRSHIDSNFEPEDKDTFMSFEEFTRYREENECEYATKLVHVYNRLLEKPHEERIEQSPDMRSALEAMHQNSITSQAGISRNWYDMTPYWNWVLQLYGPDVLEKFGSLDIVDSALLPIGMVSLFRSGRVKWRG